MNNFERSAGILLPIFSLPSNYGIGTVGAEAYKFIDFLKKAKQRYWQILPICPTSFGDSPYASFSSYAGNPYFIDLDMLVQDGLLEKEDLAQIKVEDETSIDYGYIYETRFIILEKAFKVGKTKYANEFEQFCLENSNWLDNYALYMAIKKHFKMVCWLEWDEDIRFRKKEAVEKYSKELEDDVQFYKFIQFLFFKQFNQLKEYAHQQNIKIIGDLPIYVALDSADVWANPECFQLDDCYVPTEVAGVPPDYFSEDGQLWGNPLYNWEYLKKTGYKWWLDRIDGVSKYYDVIRLDHFRGFEAYWAVPYGDKTARNGRWVKGPDYDFISVVKDTFQNVEFIAEDLGVNTPEVAVLLNKSEMPGMKILQFGFSHYGPVEHSLHNHKEKFVVYTGTHDNSTLKGWSKECDSRDVETCRRYLHIGEDETINQGIIRGGMSSVAYLFVVSFQDYLELDDQARINLPNTLGINWKWRLKANQYTEQLAYQIADMTTLYGRSGNNHYE